VPKRNAVVHPAAHDHPKPKTARAVERVSLHGPEFEEVLVGLLKVDPQAIDTGEGGDQYGDRPRPSASDKPDS
jgi:hypothetical protein